MKANELMLADWVIYKGKPHQVDNIRQKDYDNFAPIRITDEILEKNGFTNDADGMNDCDEIVSSVEYGAWQRNTEDGFKMLADGKSIRYVHELQHALRLMGLTDLSDNFKIE